MLMENINETIKGKMKNEKKEFFLNLIHADWNSIM